MSSEQSQRSFSSLWPDEEDNAQNQSPVVSESAKRPFESLWPRTDDPLPHQTAGAKVVGTFELLEAILLDEAIQWHELFVLQRVSTAWRQIIQRSSLVGQKMFLSSLEPPLEPVALHHQNGDLNTVYWPEELEFCSTTSVEGAFAPETPRMPIPSWYISQQLQFIRFSTGLGRQSADDGPIDQTPSWRNMHITRPPIPAIHLDFLPDVPEQVYRLSIYNKEGIRWGEVFDWTWELSQEHTRRTGQRLHGRLAIVSFCLARSEADLLNEVAW